MDYVTKRKITVSVRDRTTAFQLVENPKLKASHFFFGSILVYEGGT
jgi:hypothetical protein